MITFLFHVPLQDIRRRASFEPEERLERPVNERAETREDGTRALSARKRPFRSATSRVPKGRADMAEKALKRKEKFPYAPAHQTSRQG